ncbi:hypothetical protein D3C72_2584950 [compost metagenome]
MDMPAMEKLMARPSSSVPEQSKPSNVVGEDSKALKMSAYMRRAAPTSSGEGSSSWASRDSASAMMSVKE